MAVRSYPDNVAEEAGVLLAMALKKRPLEFKMGMHCVLAIADFGIGMLPDSEVDSAAMRSSGVLSDAEAFDALREIAGEYDPSDGVRAQAIGDNVVKALLPLLAKWLLNWLQNGGLEEILKRLAPQA